MTCGGIHCAGCAGGIGLPPIGLAATLGLAWVAEHLIEVALVSATCGILSVAAVIALMRWTDRREAAFGAALAARRDRPTLTAAVIPQVSQPERPAIPQVVNFNFYGAGSTMAARVIRQQLPGTSGAAITEEE